MTDIVKQEATPVAVQAEPITEPASDPQAMVALFGTTDPERAMAKVEKVAKTLDKRIRALGLSVKIGPGEHLTVEGYQLLGSLLGVFSAVTSAEPLGDPANPSGWRAHAEARTIDGKLVGSGFAICMRSEKNWANADEYALASMAQTRACGKSMRWLGFICKLANFSGTPAEEMPRDARSFYDVQATAVPQPQPPAPSPVAAPQAPAPAPVPVQPQAPIPDVGAPVFPEETPLKDPASYPHNYQLGFGKHKHMALSTIPVDYLKWMSKNLRTNSEDPSKAKFKDKCLQDLAAVNAEVQSRENPAPPPVTPPAELPQGDIPF